MALRIRFQYETGNQLAVIVSRLADGAYLDPASGTFAATPTPAMIDLPELPAPLLGLYSRDIPPAVGSAVFLDGDYSVIVLDKIRLAAKETAVVGNLTATIVNGDDATPSPATLAALFVKALAGRAITVTIPADLPPTPTPAPVPNPVKA